MKTFGVFSQALLHVFNIILQKYDQEICETLRRAPITMNEMH